MSAGAAMAEDGTRLTGPPSPLCRATKADGEPCTREAKRDGLCWSHDPENAEQRRLNSRAGGRAALGPRSPMAGELREIRDELRALVGDVRESRVGPQQGSVLVQVYNVMLRCLAEERKAKELDEIEGRLEALEGRQAS